MRGVHGAGAASTHVAGQHLVGTARGFASWTPVIERRAVLLDLAHRTPGLGYKNGSAALLQRTNTMPLYYLFGLGEIEPSSFGEEVFLVALWLFLAALLGTLIGSSLLLLILIRNDRARNNVRLGAVARDAGEDGALGGPPPRLILRRFAPAE